MQDKRSCRVKLAPHEFPLGLIGGFCQFFVIGRFCLINGLVPIDGACSKQEDLQNVFCLIDGLVRVIGFV